MVFVLDLAASHTREQIHRGLVMTVKVTLTPANFVSLHNTPQLPSFTSRSDTIIRVLSPGLCRGAFVTAPGDVWAVEYAPAWRDL